MYKYKYFMSTIWKNISFFWRFLFCLECMDLNTSHKTVDELTLNHKVWASMNQFKNIIITPLHERWQVMGIPSGNSALVMSVH